MAEENKKTIRLLMPQWQGGDYDLPPVTGEIYPLGARLLSFLAPKSETTPEFEVPVAPYEGKHGWKTNGVYQQEVVLKQLHAAREIIDREAPDRIVVFGGDCLVDQAPFSYLNEKYDGDLAVIWVDAHPDISMPEVFDREHAMVLGNLMGDGDPVFAREVKKPLTGEQVAIVGPSRFNSPKESAIVERLGMKVFPPESVFETSTAVTDWLKTSGLKHVAIHFDIDSLDPRFFYSQFPNDPNGIPFDTAPGKLKIEQVTRLILDIGKTADLVGLGIAEHMPWDAWNLKRMMESLPILK